MKPKFSRFTVWGACARCGARVRYDTLARERLTGLLMCTRASGRPVNPCFDPWPEVLDFQLKPDRSIEPPAEPMPARWGLDTLWSGGQPQAKAPADAFRIQKFFVVPGVNAPEQPLDLRIPVRSNQTPKGVAYINAQEYDGTFIPSNSVRTVVPENPAPSNLGALPWAVAKGV